MITLQASKTAHPHFGAVVPAHTLQNAAHRLPGMAQVSIPRFFKVWDFKDVGITTLPQLALIYAMTLSSRTLNAARRSKNEVREQITRDWGGFACWFLITPILQRSFLYAFAPKQYRQALLEISTKPTGNDSLLQKIRLLNWRFNPLSRLSLPSTKQVNEQLDLGLFKIRHAGFGPETAEFQQVQNYYKNLVKWRNFATGLGIIFTIGLMGVGINLYNIHITRRNMARQMQAQSQTAQTVPPPQPPMPVMPSSPAPAFMRLPTTPVVNPFSIPQSNLAGAGLGFGLRFSTLQYFLN